MQEQQGAQLTLAAFFAGMAIGQLVHGPLADRLGRRPPLLAGLALYVAASMACALAPGNDALIAARFVQALAGEADGIGGAGDPPRAGAGP